MPQPPKKEEKKYPKQCDACKKSGWISCCNLNEKGHTSFCIDASINELSGCNSPGNISKDHTDKKSVGELPDSVGKKLIAHTDVDAAFDRGFSFEGNNDASTPPILLFQKWEDGSRSLVTREYLLAFIHEAIARTASQVRKEVIEEILKKILSTDDNVEQGNAVDIVNIYKVAQSFGVELD